MNCQNKIAMAKNKTKQNSFTCIIKRNFFLFMSNLFQSFTRAHGSYFIFNSFGHIVS